MSNRKKFTTTLSTEYRQKLRILTAIEGLKSENEMIEKMIEEWGKKHDMGTESNRPRTTK